MSTFPHSVLRSSDTQGRETLGLSGVQGTEDHPLRPLARLIARLIAEGNLTQFCESDLVEHQYPGG